MNAYGSGGGIIVGRSPQTLMIKLVATRYSFEPLEISRVWHELPLSFLWQMSTSNQRRTQQNKRWCHQVSDKVHST